MIEQKQIKERRMKMKILLNFEMKTKVKGDTDKPYDTPIQVKKYQLKMAEKYLQILNRLE